MVKNCLSRSHYDAFSNLQLQSHLPSLMLCCAQPCQCVLSQPVANPHSRSATPNRPTFAQRWQWGLDRANPAQSAHFSFLRFFMWNLALTTVWCTFCRPHLPKVFRALRCFQILKCKSSSRHGPVHFLPTTFPDPAPNQRKQRRRPQEPLYPKTQGFAPESVLPVNSHASELLRFPATWWWVVDMQMWLTWWSGWHDGGNANHDKSP